MARDKLDAILTAMTKSFTRTVNLLDQIQHHMAQNRGAVQAPALTVPVIDAAFTG